MNKIGVLGAGTWGTALSILLSDNGHDVTLWTKLEKEAKALEESRDNLKNLPGAKLPEDVKITLDLKEVCTDKDLIVMAVASPYVRATAKEASPYIKEGQIIVNVSKGIEEKTLLTLADVIREEIPQADIAVMSGPSHAEEVSRRIPTTIVVGSSSKKTAQFIQDIFMNEVFRVYTSPDMIGIELGAALKNVIALAAGIIDGLGMGDNTKAALMTRGIAEISRLGIKMGGCMETFAGLSGIGDLFVTCTSRHSRNRQAGYLIGKGLTLDEVIKEVNQVVEGVNTAKAALALAKKYDVEMPIVEQINLVLFEGKSPLDAATDLLVRDKRPEYKTLQWD
ncbi:glycerol 3-phosphate dehydrogenase (NAD(P)+) [Herbinix hemicellulosilytica]|uniref:Glycerol-3-phosphate dehydrogenase [NAD(P)+] n=1 Tax=Herbinix hemicellulosilytica TaxID=1564487 RepID=A0A0H5SFT2_HERHM|nr:NAD(P)H-dependent glycerol-3-phosphate dehydrogenase [Herbinix hemicellulosilytica]RBP60660.1 glycerol 3-phosphate dehydrogenase (NAD(P)+) [Herbinix hemicellulosilytica]CRZ34347.1 Glycerol-3-phosphate dehydrogenase [NAD(P)+] [Herbinix hemicellulosilytica]